MKTTKHRASTILNRLQKQGRVVCGVFKKKRFVGTEDASFGWQTSYEGNDEVNALNPIDWQFGFRKSTIKWVTGLTENIMCKEGSSSKYYVVITLYMQSALHLAN